MTCVSAAFRGTVGGFSRTHTSFESSGLWIRRNTRSSTYFKFQHLWLTWSQFSVESKCKCNAKNKSPSRHFPVSLYTLNGVTSPRAQHVLAMIHLIVLVRLWKLWTCFSLSPLLLSVLRCRRSTFRGTFLTICLRKHLGFLHFCPLFLLKNLSLAA